MSTIEVDEQTAKRLGMLAAAQGLSVADFLRSLAGGDTQEAESSEFDLDAELEELKFDGPTLPADFSRRYLL